MQSFGGPFHSKILTCNLSWDSPNRRLEMKEVSSCHLFSEMKHTPRVHIDEVSKVCNRIKFGRHCKDWKYKDLKLKYVDRGSDCEVRWAGKNRHRN